MKSSSFAFPLSEKDRRNLYNRLAGMGARVFSSSNRQPWPSLTDEDVLAIAGEQSRFDFRLLYVLVALIAEHYERFHPFHLRQAISAIKTPQVWGVVMEYAMKVNSSTDLKSLLSILIRDLQPAPPQLYYNDLLAPNPIRALQIVDRTSDEFLNWGFFCDEAPILKELKTTGPLKNFGKATRRIVLERLFASLGKVGLKDYLEALEYSITRQQAHKDLISFPGVRRLSDRRGRVYSTSN